MYPVPQTRLRNNPEKNRMKPVSSDQRNINQRIYLFWRNGVTSGGDHPLNSSN